MLIYLELKNYIFIKELKLEFNNKLNIFTGETGAGKSIIIEAISLLCGERQKNVVVGNFAEKCEIVGIFEVKKEIKTTLSELFQEIDIPFEDEIIIRREIDKQNRTKFYINDKLISLNFVRKISDFLIDIHGQNEHQKLLYPSYQLAALDEYANLRDEVKDFRNNYNLYIKKLNLIEELKNEINKNKQQLEIMNYQITEIEQAKLTPEDETLEEELEKAKNSKKILDTLSEVKFNLNEIQQKINHIERLLQTVKNYINIDYNSIYALTTEVENLQIKIEESKKFYSNYTTEYIDNLLDRVDLIKKLKRKYGNNIEEIKKYAENLKRSIEAINIKDKELEETEKEIKQLEENLLEKAKKISKIRKESAKNLQKEINTEFSSLGLQKAKIEIKIETLPLSKENLTSTGIDKVEFLICTNPGAPFLPLKDIASGGELSRIMLAIKVVLGKKEETPILIFDEIDTGISGPMGFTIGKKLKQLSLQNKQIFCITHLPQIASFGDKHFAVRKHQLKDNTIIEVETLEDSLRVAEIARMLSGSKIDETSLKHAKNLIKEANESIN
ncbi:MAG: DNA repair protein RecN [Elusimicrobiota bacterium]|nr:DNA repair protein RecN [Endomicrobiia bacterium]MDW8165619.1 DNA repair protein RecN [Elusimicrobiota bacterium]